jgi:predicted nucleotidyltransferase
MRMTRWRSAIAMPDGKLIAPLRALHDAGVEFILVGGFAAVCTGVPVVTLDVDIVHSRDSANVARILPFLASIDAIFRIQPQRRLKPNASHLSGRGRLNLLNNLGQLDLLCTIGQDLDYEDLLPHSEETEVADNLRIRVLKLEKLIEVKAELNTDKDRAMLPILRRTLEEKRKQTKES